MTSTDYYDEALERAADILGTTERGQWWLEKMSKSLGCKPRELLTTKEGYEQVLRHLHSVELALDTD